MLIYSTWDAQTWYTCSSGIIKLYIHIFFNFKFSARTERVSAQKMAKTDENGQNWQKMTKKRQNFDFEQL